MLMLLLSTLLRLISYFFLRWVPGALFPKLIVAIYVTYVCSLFLRPRRTRGYLQWFGAEGGRSANLLNLVLNTCLLLLTFDAAVGEWIIHDHSSLQFAKVGHTTRHTAKIALRLLGHDSVQLCYAKMSGEMDTICELVDTSQSGPAADYINTVNLQHLEADTAYSYYLTTGNSEAHDRADALVKGQFKTAPEGDSRWSFLASSCIVPNFPYNPLERNNFAGWEQLYKHEITKRSMDSIPNFMFFLGDFIYFDLPFYPK